MASMVGRLVGGDADPLETLEDVVKGPLNFSVPG